MPPRFRICGTPTLLRHLASTVLEYYNQAYSGKRAALITLSPAPALLCSRDLSRAQNISRSGTSALSCLDTTAILRVRARAHPRFCAPILMHSNVPLAPAMLRIRVLATSHSNNSALKRSRVSKLSRSSASALVQSYPFHLNA